MEAVGTFLIIFGAHMSILVIVKFRVIMLIKWSYGSFSSMLDIESRFVKDVTYYDFFSNFKGGHIDWDQCEIEWCEVWGFHLVIFYLVPKIDVFRA